MAMHLTILYIMFVCHQNDVCEYSIGSVYVGGYCDLSEYGLCALGKLRPVSFLVVYKCSSQSLVMSNVDCGEDG